MGKRTGGEKTGARAMEIAEQINYAKELIIGFHNSGQIRQALADRYGLPDRTASARLAQARKMITADINEQDRQDIVAAMMEQCLKIAKEASETRQLSNSIGAMRLYGELVGVTGNGKIT